MKKLIATGDIQKAASEGLKEIVVNKNTLVTPAAHDLARELGIRFVAEKENNNSTASNTRINTELINRIVQEVLAQLGLFNINHKPQIERDISGVRLTYGQTTIFQPIIVSPTGGKVAGAHILSPAESPGLFARFISLENISYDYTAEAPEFCYVISGNVQLKIDDRVYKAQGGDAIYLPPGIRITLSCNEEAKIFVTRKQEG